MEPLESDAWHKSPSKKDTRRWCKGKVGREHVFEIRKQRWAIALHRELRCGFGQGIFADDTGWTCYHERFCVNCGKVFWYDKFECPERKESDA